MTIAQWEDKVLQLEEENDQLRRERDMAREEIAWLRERWSPRPVVGDHSDGQVPSETAQDDGSDG